MSQHLDWQEIGKFASVSRPRNREKKFFSPLMTRLLEYAKLQTPEYDTINIIL
jgi:hypothetical protein